MKKTLKLALCGLMLAGAMNAQVTTSNVALNESWSVLPAKFSADNKSKILSPITSEDEENLRVNVYNSTFKIEHTMDIKVQKITEKTVTEHRAYVAEYGEPQIIDITETFGVSMEDWKAFTQERRIKTLKIDKGTRIQILTDSIHTDLNGNVYVYHLRNIDSSLEVSLPYEVYILSGTTVTYQQITQQKTGEWEVIRVREYDYSVSLPKIWGITNLDNETIHDYCDQSLLATQTLFNEDEKYEYLRCKYEPYSHVVQEIDESCDGIIDERVTESGYECVGMEVVSEDGNIIATIGGGEGNDFEGAGLIIWEGKRYLYTELYNSEDDSYYSHIYEINPNGSGITRASSVAFMHILPAMPRKNTSVTVEFGEESVKKGGQLMITDMNGRTVYRNAVAPGETSVRVLLRRMESGVYNVTLTNDGKKVETSKLIVR
ncbi:MAG: T9SS type A sorting domain-containing protein [Bacteroidaceae bacterium]|nr:T9SS type A sorting domain-containing protein [Bacteroidaceae bacterium]